LGGGGLSPPSPIGKSAYGGHVGSVELYNVKVVKPTGSYWGDLCIVRAYIVMTPTIETPLPMEKSKFSKMTKLEAQ